MAKKKSKIVQARIEPVFGNDTSSKHPSITYSGDKAPEIGSEILFEAPNGVTYSGEVTDSAEAGGNVTVLFEKGLTPVQP